MDSLSPDSLIEAALLLQNEALGEQTMRQLCNPPLSQDMLTEVLDTLQERWRNRALQLVETAQGWRFQVRDTAMACLENLQEQRAPRYSRAVMETLAVIAYKQPVTRGDIEAIRGVSVSQGVMQILQERGWIATAGRRDTIGKPALWATTVQFLSDFQLKGLEDLPPLSELAALTLPDSEKETALSDESGE